MNIERLGITPGPWELVADAGINPDLKLIATAPEMLEALIELYDDWKNVDITDPDYFIKPIIEKATGRTWAEIKSILE